MMRYALMLPLLGGCSLYFSDPPTGGGPTAAPPVSSGV
jgi:hypothetical protein